MSAGAERGERTIRVGLGERSYDVIVNSVAGKRVASLAQMIGCGKCLVVCDERVRVTTGEEVLASLDEAGVRSVVEEFEASEGSKSMASTERLLGAMLRMGLERGDAVVAIGGGVATDLAGFAAGVYRRGVPWIAVPTTLLAMVDASVGGKTGVNLNEGGRMWKNMAGVFWQPRGVAIGVRALETLPEREFRGGLAECLKHGMLGGMAGDGSLWSWTLGMMARIRGLDSAVLVELIARNVAVKAAVVGNDEREARGADGREMLNLGHTFGHAIETMPGVSVPGHAGVTHGEAVGLGLLLASRYAEEAGLAGVGISMTVKKAIEIAGLPVAVSGLPKGRNVFDAMGRDKKIKGGKVRLIVPREIGSVCGVEADAAIVERVVEEIGA